MIHSAFFTIVILFALHARAENIDTDEKNALKGFYDNLGGPNWTDKTGWEDLAEDQKTHVNTVLFGVTTFDTHVTKISLSNNNLVNSLPGNHINKFEHLEELIINGNNITGPFPKELCDLTQHKALVKIDISNNEMTGAIPLCFDSIVYDLPLTDLFIAQKKEYHFLCPIFNYKRVLNNDYKKAKKCSPTKMQEIVRYTGGSAILIAVLVSLGTLIHSRMKPKSIEL
eukprot:350953_1